MLRFGLAGLLVVVGLIALAALDNEFSWTPPVKPNRSLTPHPVPTLTAPLPLPPAQFVPPVPPAHPEVPVPPVAAVPPPEVPSPPVPRIAPVPSAVPPVPGVTSPKKNRPIPVEAASNVTTDLAAARDMLNDGQIAEARHLLSKVQFRMVLTKVTPDQPIREDVNIVATRIGEAIRQLDHGDTDAAKRTINQVLTNGF